MAFGKLQTRDLNDDFVLPVEKGGTGGITTSEALNNLKGLSNLAAYYPSSSPKEADELLDGLALLYCSSTNNADLLSIFGSFAYVLTFFNSSISLTSNRTQIAFGYNTDPIQLATRRYYNGTWSSWQVIGISSDEDYATTTYVNDSISTAITGAIGASY